MQKRITCLFGVVAGALVLASCGGGGGGGGGDGDKGSHAEGIFRGYTPSGRNVLGLARADGTYWMLYTDEGASHVAGVVQGTGSVSDGTFSSTDGKDFNVEGNGIEDVTIRGSYEAGVSLSGSVIYDDSSRTPFSLDYDADYESTPCLDTLAGYRSGTTPTVGGGSERAAFTISSSGAIDGSGESGCTFTGTATPDAHGNLFNLTVTFGGGVCEQGTATVKGIGYLSGDRFFAVATNGARDNGFIFAED